MDTRQIEQLFDARIKHVFYDKEYVKRFILSHERKQVVITNILEQVKLCEWNRATKFNAKELKFLVESIADTFASAALKQKEQSLMSAAAKQAIIAEANRLQYAQELASEVMKEI